MEEDIATFTKPKLPEDLVFNEILSKLPAKSLIRFKCVSKTWLTRISSDPSFIAAHQNHHSNTNTKLSIILGTYKEDDQSRTVTKQRLSLLSETQCSTPSATDIDMSYIENIGIAVVGSTNGLVCLQINGPHDPTVRVALWNPAIRQLGYVEERPPEELSVEASHDSKKKEHITSTASLGFGFDDESKDYKIVDIVAKCVRRAHRFRLESLRARVFAKSRGGWREGNGVLGLSGIRVEKSAVVSNGALHWVGLKKGERKERTKSCILSFSLHDEVLRVTDLPDDIRCSDLSLCKWKASLAALVHTSAGECCLWMATARDNNVNSNNDGDVKQGLCWSKMFKIDPLVIRAGSLRGVLGDQFMVVRHSRQGFKLSLHDPTVVGQVRKLKIPGPCLNLCDAHDYVESLVSVF